MTRQKCRDVQQKCMKGVFVMHSGDEDCMITYSEQEAKRFAELNDGYIIEKPDKDGNVVYYVHYYIDR